MESEELAPKPGCPYREYLYLPEYEYWQIEFAFSLLADVPNRLFIDELAEAKVELVDGVYVAKLGQLGLKDWPLSRIERVHRGKHGLVPQYTLTEIQQLRNDIVAALENGSLETHRLGESSGQFVHRREFLAWAHAKLYKLPIAMFEYLKTSKAKDFPSLEKNEWRVWEIISKERRSFTYDDIAIGIGRKTVQVAIAGLVTKGVASKDSRGSVYARPEYCDLETIQKRI